MTDTTPADSEPTQPLAVPLSDLLGPLPAPAVHWPQNLPLHGGGEVQAATYYRAEDMRAYALQERAAERERCAKLVETQDTNGDYGVQSWFDLLAAKIRA